MSHPYTTLGVALLVIAFSGFSQATKQKNPARAALDEYVTGFWIKRDTSALSRAMTPTMVYHYNGEIIPGEPEAHMAALESFGDAFQDLTASVDVFTASEDLAAAVTTWNGTHTGVLCSTLGKGEKATWVVFYVFRIADGRIVELWEAWDEGGTYRKLGVDISKCES